MYCIMFLISKLVSYLVHYLVKYKQLSIIIIFVIIEYDIVVWGEISAAAVDPIFKTIYIDYL